MSELGFTLHMLRRRRGWTQGQLAQRARTTPEYISQLERGKKTNPGIDLLTRLALALETTPDFILIQAGMLPVSDNMPLPPEVAELVETIEAYPDGPAKEQAKQMVVDIALILRTLRERVEADREGAAGRPESGV
ncbi:MAG: helix-turn-helix domain-containing protein [Armatimonadetes bacterium]|nr:helix-turn-helix domain-containing protein [Armatimonadota bacterium]NIO98659.1 helix-turn-helix domain-containing protein [Armatimonadota bacterium]